MARIQLNRPDKFHYITQIRINVSMLNYGDHLSNEQILSMAHEARLRFFHSLGASEFDFWGPGLIQTDAAVVYRSEGHYADEIAVGLYITELSRAGFDVQYAMRNVTTDKDLAIAKTGIVCFDYDEKKVRELPEPFINLISKIELLSFSS